MSGDENTSGPKGANGDETAGGKSGGETFSSFLKDKAPNMSRILQEEEARTAALAAGNGGGDTDDMDLDFTEAAGDRDGNGDEADDEPFVIVEEESFDISFDHLDDDNEGTEDVQAKASANDAPEDETSPDTVQVGFGDALGDGFDENDLGPPLPDLSAEDDETSEDTPDDDLPDIEFFDDEGQAVESPADTFSIDTENADEPSDPTPETPENAEPLTLAELDADVAEPLEQDSENLAPIPRSTAPDAEAADEVVADDDDVLSADAFEIEMVDDDDTAAAPGPASLEEPTPEPEAELERQDDTDSLGADSIVPDLEEGPENEATLPEPPDEFADWGVEETDEPFGEEDLGPPLPDLSAPAEPDSEADEEPIQAADDEVWPDGDGFEPPPVEMTEADAAESDDADADIAFEEDEELTLEIEGLDFQPGDALAEDDAPEEDGPGEDAQSAERPPEPDPVTEPEPEETGPAPGIAEAAAKPVSVQQALMAAIELHRTGDLEGAARGYEGLVRRFPNSAAGWINLGIVLRRLGKLDAALVCLRRGVMLNPKDGAAWSNLGNALRAANYLRDAKRAQIKAISQSPGAAQIHYNMGLVTRDFGDLAEADACFRRAELLGYDNPDLPWDQSLTLLLSGNLEEGFDAYEARWNLPETVARYADMPRWNGAPEPDKTIVIHAEQGLGDSLQFCRYIPVIKSRAGRMIFEVQPPLVDLLKSSPRFDGVEIVARNHELAEADLQMPLLSAPSLLPLGESVLPGRDPYLTPPPDGPRIGETGNGPRIGIAWAGRPTHKNDANRSAGLSTFTALFDVLEARFYSLQVGPAQAEINALSLSAVVQDLSPAIRSFADTASLLQDLDLVITVDTSVAHLAGAMGKPVWVMLPFAPDWRWQLNREDSPWYPSMRLFRQTGPGDWDGVFMRMRAALDEWIASESGAETD